MLLALHACLISITLLTHFLAESLKSFKSKFSTSVAAVRWASTNGLRMLLQIWYSREPMYWIPKGWVPGYVEWLLAFPRAPRGSVSILIWGMACAAVVKMALAAVASGMMLGVQGKQADARARREPVAMGTAGGEKRS